jgi:hypothetical protein
MRRSGVNDRSFRNQHREGYFAAFVRDPDGNNSQAVCHG